MHQQLYLIQVHCRKKAHFIHPIAAVCIRTSTERPEALEAGDFILAGITTKELLNATDMAIEMKQKGVLGKPCPDYVDETVSMKVVRIIQGYVNVVNKMVWRFNDGQVLMLKLHRARHFQNWRQ